MKRKKHGIGVIDIVIIASILIILAFFVYICFYGSIKNAVTDTETFDVTLLVTEINSKHSPFIKVGEEIAINNSTEYCGSIKNVKFTKTNFEYTNKATNTSSTYKLPDKENATILAELRGSISKDNYYISDTLVSQGDTITLNTSGYSFSAKIIKIEKR